MHLGLFYTEMQARFDSVTQISLDLPSDRSGRSYFGGNKVLATPSWITIDANSFFGCDHNRRH
jgi:hypothetical protein|tara:strand:- start:236 stop:424 length:189 start_codon:yes stop_codon:yes gene_type:complete